MDGAFLEAVRPLHHPMAGTESRAWVLYGLVRMTRPRMLLEVGVGYTTPFLLQAMADNVADAEGERRRLTTGVADDALDPIDPAFHREPYAPRLVACDRDASRMERVRAVAESLGLEGRLEAHTTDFHILPKRLAPETPPFDFAFFDCGGPPEYVDFLRGFWPRIAPRNGHLVLDFTYWTRRPRMADGRVRSMLVPGSILNEIKRQQAQAGLGADFEALSLVEPHKRHQGSLTLIRRLSPASAIRDHPLDRDLELMRATPVDGVFDLG